jgi:hypothetical protein
VWEQVGEQVVVAVDVRAESEMKSTREVLGQLGVWQSFHESLLQEPLVIPGAWVCVWRVKTPRIFLEVEPETVLLLHQPIRTGKQCILQDKGPVGHGPSPVLRKDEIC